MTTSTTMMAKQPTNPDDQDPNKLPVDGQPTDADDDGDKGDDAGGANDGDNDNAGANDSGADNGKDDNDGNELR